MADPRTKKILYTPGSGNPDGIPGLFPTQKYELLSDGYSESFVDGQPSITIRVRTRWNGSYQFVVNMLGTATADLTSPTGMNRFPPAQYNETDFQATIITQGDANTAFLGWWCTSAKLVGTHGEMTCQDQVTGALVPPIKPDSMLESGVDFDATTGILYDGGYDVDNKPIQTGVGFAEYELTYEPLPYEILTDAQQATLDAPLNANEMCRFLIRRFRFGGNAFTLAPGSLYWADRLGPPIAADARVDSSATRPFPNANLTYTLLNSPAINWNAINDCIGKVNRPNTNNGLPIGSGGTELPGAPGGVWDYRPTWQGISVPGGIINGFASGTLLFEGISDIVPKISAAGQLLYDQTFNFFYRKEGHNFIYRAADDQFKRVIRSATKDLAATSWKNMIDEADFNQLFTI